jgi:hypothetical protein
MGLSAEINLRVDSFVRLIKSILVLLSNPFFLLLIVTFSQVKLQCSSSSSHRAVSLGREKGPTKVHDEHQRLRPLSALTLQGGAPYPRNIELQIDC